jgi:hypothetical protein
MTLRQWLLRYDGVGLLFAPQCGDIVFCPDIYTIDASVDSRYPESINNATREYLP